MAGLLQAAPRDDGANVSRWLPYLSVGDVDTAVQRVTSAGGEVIVAPRNVPLGRVAAIADDQGAIIGLARSNVGDPDDATTAGAVGRVVWNELVAENSTEAARFYERVFGYRASEIERRGGRYVILAASGADRAGILQEPAPEWPAVWLTYFGVADPVAAAASAEALGGKVLLAPSATWNITPDTDLTGLFYYQKDVVLGDTNGFLPVYGTLLDNPLGKVDPSVNLGDPENRFEREQSGIGYEFSHAFNDNVSFISNAKFSNYEESTPTGIYGGGGLVDDDFDGTPDDYRTVQQYNFSYKEEVEGFATDNRFDVSLVQGALSHDIIGGVDYRTVDNKAAYGFIFANRIDLFEPVYMPQATLEPGYPFAFNDQELTQTGVYVQDHIGYDKFFVTVSARQDWVEIDSELTGNKTKQDKFTYRVGGNYIFDNGIAPYISYATSFEPVLGVDAVTNEDFKPSEGEQFEIGVKYDARGLPDGIDLLMSGAIYQITQKNVVSTAPSVTPVSGTQSGEVEVNGVELELVSRINDQLSINASYSYTDSEVVESGTAVEIGSPLPVTPKNKASVFVDYTVNAGSLAGLGFGAGVRYTDESNGALPGPFAPVVYTGEESTLVDAIIRYDINKWRFAINGSNLLDEEYVARCASASGCTYGAGRQLIATVKKSF